MSGNYVFFELVFGHTIMEVLGSQKSKIFTQKQKLDIAATGF